MPSAYVEKIAKELKVPVKQIEGFWEKAKAIAGKRFKGKKTGAFYAYTTGILKNMLSLSQSGASHSTISLVPSYTSESLAKPKKKSKTFKAKVKPKAKLKTKAKVKPKKIKVKLKAKAKPKTEKSGKLSKWWKSLTAARQQAYLTKHPKSKYAKAHYAEVDQKVDATVDKAFDEVKDHKDFTPAMNAVSDMQEGKPITDEEAETLKPIMHDVGSTVVGALSVISLFAPIAPFASAAADMFLESSKGGSAPKADKEGDMEVLSSCVSGISISASTPEEKKDKDNKVKLAWLMKSFTKWLNKQDLVKLHKTLDVKYRKGLIKKDKALKT
jgi:hypothetical protein